MRRLLARSSTLRLYAVVLLFCVAPAALAPAVAQVKVPIKGLTHQFISGADTTLISGGGITKNGVPLASARFGLRDEAGSFTAVQGDEDELIRLTGTSQTVTLPTGLADGTALVFLVAGAGAKTLAPGVGASGSGCSNSTLGSYLTAVVTVADTWTTTCGGSGSSAIGSEDPASPSNAAGYDVLYYVDRAGSPLRSDSVFYWSSADSLARVLVAGSLPGADQLGGSDFSTLVFEDTFAEGSEVDISAHAPDQVPSGGDATWSAAGATPPLRVLSGQARDIDGSGQRAGFIDLGTLASSFRVEAWHDGEKMGNEAYVQAFCVGGTTGSPGTGICLSFTGLSLRLGTAYEGTEIDSASMDISADATDAANYFLSLETDGATVVGAIYAAGDLVTPIAIVNGSLPALGGVGLFLAADASTNGWHSPFRIYE